MKKGPLSVALLLSDLNDVKDISAVFRKLGVIPHFYEDLKTFLEGTTENIPSLSIVDVLKMSEQELKLLDHPAAIAEKLPLVFFYSKNTEPLLLSTYDFYHLGLIKKQENYEGALKVILKRLNHQIKIESENQLLKSEAQKQSEEIDRLKLERLTLEKSDQYQSMVKRVCLRIEELRGETEFFKALEKVFQEIDEIAEFSMLELSFNGQKLISPHSQAKKFRVIPSLWLGQACHSGIEIFAQNMGTQVALELMGGDLVSLLIKGSASRPDKMIFIKSQNELFYNNFDWNMLEAYLNGFYASYRNQINKDQKNEKKIGSPFEAMSLLDQSLFGTNKLLSKNDTQLKDLRLIDLDLSHLAEVIAKKNSNRFYWNKFEQEFINKLEIQSRLDFKFFSYGVNHISFLVQSQDVDQFFDSLKEFATKFAYWKYFEESEGILSQIINPKIKMFPVSAFAYLKAIKDGEAGNLDKLNDKATDKTLAASKKTHELIWGREKIHEI